MLSVGAPCSTSFTWLSVFFIPSDNSTSLLSAFAFSTMISSFSNISDSLLVSLLISSSYISDNHPLVFIALACPERQLKKTFFFPDIMHPFPITSNIRIALIIAFPNYFIHFFCSGGSLSFCSTRILHDDDLRSLAPSPVGSGAFT